MLTQDSKAESFTCYFYKLNNSENSKALETGIFQVLTHDIQRQDTATETQ